VRVSKQIRFKRGALTPESSIDYTYVYGRQSFFLTSIIGSKSKENQIYQPIKFQVKNFHSTACRRNPNSWQLSSQSNDSISNFSF